MFFYWLTCEDPQGKLIYKPESRPFIIVRRRHLCGSVYEYVLLSVPSLVFLTFQLVLFLSLLWYGYSFALVYTPKDIEQLRTLYALAGAIIPLDYILIPWVLYIRSYKKWKHIIDVEAYPQGIIPGNPTNFRASLRGCPNDTSGMPLFGFGETRLAAVDALIPKLKNIVKISGPQDYIDVQKF